MKQTENLQINIHRKRWRIFCWKISNAILFPLLECFATICMRLKIQWGCSKQPIANLRCRSGTDIFPKTIYNMGVVVLEMLYFQKVFFMPIASLAHFTHFEISNLLVSVGPLGLPAILSVSVVHHYLQLQAELNVRTNFWWLQCTSEELCQIPTKGSFSFWKKS